MQRTYDQTVWDAEGLVREATRDVPALVLTIEVLISAAFWSLVAWRLWPVFS